MKYLILVMAALAGSVAFGQADDVSSNAFEACYLIVRHASGKATVAMFHAIVNDQNGKVYEAQAEEQIVRLFHNSGKPTVVGANSLGTVLRQDSYERQIIQYTNDKNQWAQKVMADREERIADHRKWLNGDPRHDAVINKMIEADKVDTYDYSGIVPPLPTAEQNPPVYWMYQAGVRGSAGMSSGFMPVAERFAEELAGVDSEQKLFRFLVDPTTYRIKSIPDGQVSKNRTTTVSCAPIM